MLFLKHSALLNVILHFSQCLFANPRRSMLFYIPLNAIFKTFSAARCYFTSLSMLFYIPLNFILQSAPLNVILHFSQCYMYFTFLSISFYNPRRSMLHRAHMLTSPLLVARPMLGGPYGPLNREGSLQCNTRDLGFCSLIQRTSQIESLFTTSPGYWGWTVTQNEMTVVKLVMF